MSDTTDPTWTLALWIILGGLGFGIVWTLLSILAAILYGRVVRTRREQDAQTAADFREPTRTEVEADLFWAYFPAPEASDTPIYTQMRHEEDVWFAASVLADIDDLPGGAA